MFLGEHGSFAFTAAEQKTKPPPPGFDGAHGRPPQHPVRGIEPVVEHSGWEEVTYRKKGRLRAPAIKANGTNALLMESIRV